MWYDMMQYSTREWRMEKLRIKKVSSYILQNDILFLKNSSNSTSTTSINFLFLCCLFLILRKLFIYSRHDAVWKRKETAIFAKRFNLIMRFCALNWLTSHMNIVVRQARHQTYPIIYVGNLLKLYFNMKVNSIKFHRLII